MKQREAVAFYSLSVIFEPITSEALLD